MADYPRSVEEATKRILALFTRGQVRDGDEPAPRFYFGDEVGDIPIDLCLLEDMDVSVAYRGRRDDYQVLIQLARSVEESLEAWDKRLLEGGWRQTERRRIGPFEPEPPALRAHPERNRRPHNYCSPDDVFMNINTPRRQTAIPQLWVHLFASTLPVNPCGQPEDLSWAVPEVMWPEDVTPQGRSQGGGRDDLRIKLDIETKRELRALFADLADQIESKGWERLEAGEQPYCAWGEWRGQPEGVSIRASLDMVAYPTAPHQKHIRLYVKRI